MTPSQESGVRGWVRRKVRRAREWATAAYESAVPARRARRGASLGAALALLLVLGLIGASLRTSLSLPVDLLIVTAIGVSLMFLLAAALLLMLRILRALPRWLGFAGTGAAVALVLLFTMDMPPQLGVAVGLGLAVTGALLVGALAALTSGDFGASGRRRKAAVLGGLLVSLGAIGWLVWWLAQTGTDTYLVEAPAETATVATLEAPDPSQRGPFTVRTLTYGSGTDLQRPEFGAQVAMKTEPVDAEPFVKGFEGWRRKLRKLYWDFDADAFPLNGRVWYPDGAGPFPLILVVHGNHSMTDYSDPGYAYLGEHLASRGFIVVSVDENFLNGWIVGGLRRENDARGWMLLKHFEQWKKWNETEGNPFFGKVDFNNLGLIGHSRGGEAAAHAGAFNRMARYPDDATVELGFHFPIKAIVAIAPSDAQYKPAGRPEPLENVNYFVIQGGHDSDVAIFMGDRQYNRVRFTDGGDWFKASLWVYRANHGQFNTVWGDSNWGAPPANWMLNRKPLLTGEEQRQVARVYFTAFFEATLKGDKRYRELFRDPRRARPWLPKTQYLSRYEDASFQPVAEFEEDVDVTTGTLPGARLEGEGLAVWREQDIQFRSDWMPRENNGVYLGWRPPEPDEERKQPASYTVTLPAGFARAARLDASGLLVFQLAQADEKPPKDKDKNKKKGEAQEDDSKKEDKEEKDEKIEPVDLSIELVATDGTAVRLPLSRFRALAPVLKSRFTKIGMIEKEFYQSESEPVLQTFELPLAAFVEAGPKFRPENLSAVRLVFDRSPQGVVILDRLGLARPFVLQSEPQGKPSPR